MNFGYGVDLSRICEADLPVILKWRNNWEIWRWARQAEPIHDLSQERWYKRQAEEPSISMFKILDAENTPPIGVCGFTSIDHFHGRAEFGIYVAPELQGRGKGKATLKTLFRHGFDNLGLNLIWGETFDGNPAAGLFEKIGMKREGTRRQFFWKDGQFTDAHLYSMLRSEWKNSR